MGEHTRNPMAVPPSGDPTGWLSEEGRWEHGTHRRAVLRGVARYDASAYHEPGLSESIGRETNLHR